MLQDPFGRKISYLRLSVTDRCDFRCTYCMAEQMQFVPRAEIMTLEECLFVASTFVALGIDKIRLTGGEPLVRKELPWLAAKLRALPGLRELALTTNGSQLQQHAASLAQAGVDRINISLDSLDAENFSRLTRGGDLNRVLAGIAAALEHFGPGRVKLNTVLLRDANQQELEDILAFALAHRIDLSFIEQMPLGDTGHAHAATFYGSAEALAHIRGRYDLIPCAETSGGPARYWRIPGQASRIGFISPHTENFCAGCNRMRLSAKGELFACLGNEGKVDLLPAIRAGDEIALRGLIQQAVNAKPEAHEFDLGRTTTGIVRFMSHTGG